MACNSGADGRCNVGGLLAIRWKLERLLECETGPTARTAEVKDSV